MFAKWTRILPYCLVFWFAKRRAERIAAMPGFISVNPYDGEILSWRIVEKKEE